MTQHKPCFYSVESCTNKNNNCHGCCTNSGSNAGSKRRRSLCNIVQYSDSGEHFLKSMGNYNIFLNNIKQECICNNQCINKYKKNWPPHITPNEKEYRIRLEKDARDSAIRKMNRAIEMAYTTNTSYEEYLKHAKAQQIAYCPEAPFAGQMVIQN
jgi:hypothetical protein